MPNKLKLKRTAEEETQHRLRKEKRREKRKRHHDDDYSTPWHIGVEAFSSKRAHIDRTEEGLPRKWASSDEEEIQHGPQPAAATSSHIPQTDYDAIKARIEEDKFREKMFEAMGDDDRLDSVEAHFNDFAHVPHRWRTTGSNNQSNDWRRDGNTLEDDDLFKLDPRHMDDEEYTEWIRAGMYRKTHAAEYAEQQRKKAARAARRAEEKARKAETVRLEKEAEAERKQMQLEREARKMDYAREEYNSRWITLLAVPGGDETVLSNAQVLTFDDIPWPIASAYRSRANRTRPNRRIGVCDLTTEAVASFLLPTSGAVEIDATNEELETKLKKNRKDKLRETFLRFHPDKFEGRFMKRFKEEDWAEVREAIGQVSRALSHLLGSGV